MYLQNLSKSWQLILQKECKKSYFLELLRFLESEKSKNTVFPKETDVFKAFELTPFEAVQVVIIGQDPYYGLNQAHGLSFSVTKNSKIPPSLKNIFKELQSDLGISMPLYGDLSH